MKAASDRRVSQAGFTLVEVVVAMAILAVVILAFLGTRTDAMVDASEARNWRLAKEVAEQMLSELEAGAMEQRPELGRRAVEGYKDFEYEIVVGEAAIGQHDSYSLDSFAPGADNGRNDRLSWQRERDELRRAQQRGMSLNDYRDQELEEEISLDNENRIPSEEDFEEVMVVVYFPNVRLDAEELESSFTLKARLPTLAIEGMTPEEADTLARAQGAEPSSTIPPEGGPQ